MDRTAEKSPTPMAWVIFTMVVSSRNLGEPNKHPQEHNSEAHNSETRN